MPEEDSKPDDLILRSDPDPAHEIARQPVYLYRLPDDCFLYVSVDSTDEGYTSFRLFLGEPTSMRRVEVRNVERHRDGGTTYVSTDEGELYSPTTFNKRLVATWNGALLVKLDASAFHIEESDMSVAISHSDSNMKR